MRKMFIVKTLALLQNFVRERIRSSNSTNHTVSLFAESQSVSGDGHDTSVSHLSFAQKQVSLPPPLNGHDDHHHHCTTFNTTTSTLYLAPLKTSDGALTAHASLAIWWRRKTHCNTQKKVQRKIAPQANEQANGCTISEMFCFNRCFVLWSKRH